MHIFFSGYRYKVTPLHIDILTALDQRKFALISIRPYLSGGALNDLFGWMFILVDVLPCFQLFQNRTKFFFSKRLFYFSIMFLNISTDAAVSKFSSLLLRALIHLKFKYIVVILHLFIHFIFWLDRYCDT